jgi:riboflavin synthase
MFTGIIETTGLVKRIERKGSNYSFWIESVLLSSLKVDQSLSHNGVCLTIEELNDNLHKVTAIDETLAKTNLGQLEIGSIVNLERCMQLNGRLDGHMVQGHVDAIAICMALSEKDGSWEYSFEFDEKFAGLTIEKGSITLNGISLTIFNITKTRFTVAIIPYTYEHTNICTVKIGSVVNLEFDMIGKYVKGFLELKNN